MKNYEEVKKQLKTEFFGIDAIIDEIVDSFKLWESIKDYQNKPIIVNLWGLTGVGKTSLVNRVSELLEVSDRRINIQFNGNNNQLTEQLQEQSVNDLILVFDEFQYLRTIDESGCEIKKDGKDDEINIIWELLDKGTIHFYQSASSWFKWQLVDLLYNIKFLAEDNVTFKKGYLYHPKLHKILNKYNIEHNYKGEKEKYIADTSNEDIIQTGVGKDSDSGNYSFNKAPFEDIFYINYEELFKFSQKKNCKYAFINKLDLKKYVNSLGSIYDLISVLEDILEAPIKPKIKDFTHSMIFVLGNLDECYSMSYDLNSDLDADYFYRKTKKINIANIKSALQKRFRAEQISRLGNKHIIYPSLTKNAFQNIIKKELNIFKNTIKDKFDFINDVTFSNNIEKIIYKEGVFPIQGVRPIFSTVNDIVIDKFPLIIETLLIHKDIKYINFDYIKNNIIINFYNNDKQVIKTEHAKYQPKIDNLRGETDKDKRSIISVHESGHAVASIVLLKTIPEAIFSSSLEKDKYLGVTIVDEENSPLAHVDDYMNDIAVNLGGYAAEKLIFGEKKISAGSSGDLENASRTINILFKRCGFSSNFFGSYISDNVMDINLSQIIDSKKLEEEIKTKLLECLAIAEETLKKEEKLLLKLSEYLSNHYKISQKQIKKFINLYAIDKNLSKESVYYNILQEKLSSIK